MNLLPYQVPHARQLYVALKNNGAAIDASDTGTGKSYAAAAVCKAMGLKAFVVCPKSVVPIWREILNGFDCDIIDVINYEKLRTGNTPYGNWPSKRKVRGKTYHGRFSWNLPYSNTLLIFDESHKCKGPKTTTRACPETLNAKMLKAARNFGVTTLMLSATAADSPLEMRSLGYVLKLHDDTNHYGWSQKFGARPGFFGGLEFPRGPETEVYLQALHSMIYPSRGARMRTSEIPDFPETLITSDSYAVGNPAKLQKKIDDALEAYEAENPDTELNPLTALLTARQATEIEKVPALVEMAKDAVEEGQSVAIFVNFTEPRIALQKALKCPAVYGTQSGTEREKAIKDFQADRERIIVVNIQAGGVGIGLHDTHGNYPRLALICPTYSAQDLKQVLGRVHRAGAKSKSVQRIIFAAGTVEEQACEAVRGKLNNIELLNDGELGEGII